MNRSVRCAIGCLCVLLGLQTFRGSAQEKTQTGDESDQDESQAPLESHARISVPAPLGGFSPQLTAYPETAGERTNLLLGSIELNALYTGSGVISGAKSTGDLQYSVIPGIGWQSFSPRTQWLVNYAGGLTFDQRSPGSSQQTQGGAADLRHQFTQRLVSEFRQDYVFTNGPFTQVGPSPSLPAVAGPGQLSPFAMPSNTTRVDSISSANLTYQVSRHSGLGGSGSFSDQKYRDLSLPSGTGGSLIDTQIATGRAFYLVQVSAHHSIGMEYQMEDMKFADGTARTGAQTLFLFDGISFKGNMTLSLFAGPQLTHTHNALLLSPTFTNIVVPVLSDELSVTGGFAYTWQGSRAGFRLSGERGVSDGGGFMGAVRLNTAALEMRKTMGAHWNATLQLVYSDGHLIGLPTHIESGRVTTEEGLIGLTRRLTPRVSVMGQYARIHQPHAGTLTQRIQAKYNRAQIGLTYQFQRALTQ